MTKLMGLGRWRREMRRRSGEGAEIAILDGKPVEYCDSGGTGPAVLHFSSGPASCHKLLPKIPQAGFRLVTFGRPGCMGTPITSGRDYEDQVALAAALLSHLGIERAAVIGISQSGPFPPMFGLRYPERATCLVVYSGITKAWSLKKPMALSEKIFLTDGAMWLVWNAASVFGWGFLITAWSKTSGVDAQYVKTTPEINRLFHTLFEVSLPPSGNKDAIENDEEQAKALPRLPVEELTCPVLVLHGTNDTAVPVEHGRFVAEHALHAEAHFFEGGGHLLLLDEKFHEEVDRVLLDFLRRHAV
jgi:pimeloyl-ACP methyl ester carboxylesterase